MKTIMKIFGGICAVVGWTVIFCYILSAVVYGPKKAWKYAKDAFHYGYNYRF